MTRAQLAQIGFWVAVSGTGIVALSLIPAINQGSPLPWPIFVGSTVYIMGSLCLAFNARGESGKKSMTQLRYVRLSLVVIVITLLQQVSRR